MNVAARMNRRITQLAVGRHLPYRTVRMRLTLLYGGLFVVSGAALMAIGHPVKQITRLRRQPVAEFAWVDRFDGQPFTD